jgi:ribonuclease HI
MPAIDAKSLQHVTIYTDGGCLGNPGPGGYGVVLIYAEKRREISGGFRLTTNNRMELTAAIVGLETLKRRCKVAIHTDSQYLANGIQKGWAINWRRNNWIRDGKDVPNADLWARLLDLCDAHEVSFVWVRGHAGNKENERCDELAVAAASGPDLPPDEGYAPQLGAASHRQYAGSTPRPPAEKPTEAAQKDVRAGNSGGPLTEAGQPCRKCRTPVERRTPRQRPKPGSAYYYEYYLFCPGCGTMYMVDAAKRRLA